VKWISLTASKNNGAVQLEWKIDEKNNQRFEVERSEDGRTYQQIGIVQSKGDGEHSYRFEDTRAGSGRRYFRIKQVDKDSRFSWSQVVKIDADGKDLMVVNQTVVTTQLNVNLPAQGTGNARLFISDVSGRVLFNSNAKAGLNTLATANLRNGIYLLTYTNDKDVLQTVRFMKQ
jgi:hypothetical protein